MVYYKHTHKHIHKIIRKHAPKSVHKVKKLFYFKYLKLILLIASIFLAYYLFTLSGVLDFFSNLQKLNYAGMMIAGMLFSFGFSAPFSFGFFIISQPENLFLAAILAGIGSVIGDMLIFKTIKLSFKKEFKELNHEKIVKTIEKAIEHNKNILIRHYLLYIFAGILIVTPLPDEIGISMLAGLTTIKPLKLAVISFMLHSLAVFLILYFSAVL